MANPGQYWRDARTTLVGVLVSGGRDLAVVPVHPEGTGL